MGTRGEEQFIKFPKFAANLYDYLTSGRWSEVQRAEIAGYLVSKINRGRLLDIGTGPGKLLMAINRLNPEIELYGLDISESMIKLARKNLKDIPVDLHLGNIQKTEYEDDFFDLVTCTGSFYLWDSPEECLEEIHRILDFKCSAYLFETYRDHDANDFKEALRSNLKKESLLRKLFGPYFLSTQLKMTYNIVEIESIINRTRFKNNYHTDKVTLGGLPIWLRIELRKSKLV